MAYSSEYRSAQDVLAGESAHGSQNDLNEQARLDAEEAGVTASEYVGYAKAFDLYEARPDVEPLAARRAREAATSASEQDFRREGTGSAAVFTSPKDGNVGGLKGADGQPIPTPGDADEPNDDAPADGEGG